MWLLADIPNEFATFSHLVGAPRRSCPQAIHKNSGIVMLKLKSTRRTASRVNVAESARRPTEGLKFARVFSQKAIAPFDEIEWEQRTAEITDDSGKAIFKQENVEVPKTWSVLATKVVCSKYFYGDPAKAEREHSVRQLIHRVTRTIADWA